MPERTTRAGRGKASVAGPHAVRRYASHLASRGSPPRMAACAAGAGSLHLASPAAGEKPGHPACSHLRRASTCGRYDFKGLCDPLSTLVHTGQASPVARDSHHLHRVHWHQRNVVSVPRWLRHEGASRAATLRHVVEECVHERPCGDQMRGDCSVHGRILANVPLSRTVRMDWLRARTLIIP